MRVEHPRHRNRSGGTRLRGIHRRAGDPDPKVRCLHSGVQLEPANDFDTRYGLDSYTVQVPNITATSTTPQSRGGGTFTPRR